MPNVRYFSVLQGQPRRGVFYGIRPEERAGWWTSQRGSIGLNSINLVCVNASGQCKWPLVYDRPIIFWSCAYSEGDVSCFLLRGLRCLLICPIDSEDDFDTL